MSDNKYKKFTLVVSIVLPLAVAALFGIKIPNVEPLSFLPPIYAGINGLTAVLLIAAVIAIKKGNRKAHEGLMKTSLVLSILFLVMYVAYHMTSDSTVYGDLDKDGVLNAAEAAAISSTQLLYYIILISHILLSIAIIPLVLITYTRALSELFDKHKKIAKIAFPLWLYVAISGVVVYLMISPYYI